MADSARSPGRQVSASSGKGEPEGQRASIRVAVRVRPLLPADGQSGTSFLQLASGTEMQLTTGSGERRTSRAYAFDQAFGPEVSQVRFKDSDTT